MVSVLDGDVLSFSQILTSLMSLSIVAVEGNPRAAETASGLMPHMNKSLNVQYESAMTVQLCMHTGVSPLFKANGICLGYFDPINVENMLSIEMHYFWGNVTDTTTSLTNTLSVYFLAKDIFGML